jgi:hypothetical protein
MLDSVTMSFFFFARSNRPGCLHWQDLALWKTLLSTNLASAGHPVLWSLFRRVSTWSRTAADGTRMSCVVTPVFICSACSGLRIHLAFQEHADRLALFSVDTTRAPFYVQTVCTVAALLFVAALSITLTANTISRPTLAPSQPTPTVRCVPHFQLQTVRDCIESRLVPRFIYELLLIA